MWRDSEALEDVVDQVATSTEIRRLSSVASAGRVEGAIGATGASAGGGGISRTQYDGFYRSETWSERAICGS